MEVILEEEEEEQCDDDSLKGHRRTCGLRYKVGLTGVRSSMHRILELYNFFILNLALLKYELYFKK